MKKLLFGLLAMLCFAVGNSQSFMHGIGINVFVSSVSGGQSNVTGGISYTPRVNFIEGDDMSVSAGLPFTVGFTGSGSYNSRSGVSDGSSVSFVFNAPLIVNLNMGAGSTKDAESRFGYFVGAGYGYHYGMYVATDAIVGDVSTQFSTTGPVANAGIRLGVGSHSVEVRVQYMKGLSDVKPNIFSAGAAFVF
jgi:hypothetical protein